MRRNLISFALLFSAVVSRAQGPSTQQVKNPLGNAPPLIQAGHELFNKTCTGCHGIDGGEGGRAPALGGNRRYFRLSEGAIFDAVKHGIPGTGMPNLGLSDDEAWRIVSYIRSLRGVALDAAVQGDVEKGMAIFQGKAGCVKCHMLRGEGGTIGPDLSSVGAQVTLAHLREELTTDLPIPSGFAPVTVVDKNGQRLSGIAKNNDAFSIQILDEHNKLHTYDKKTLRSAVVSQKSLMPHNYDKTLSPQELQDLLAMLSRQAKTKVHVALERENEEGR